jgi:hypothetical protein
VELSTKRPSLETIWFHHISEYGVAPIIRRHTPAP